MPVIPIIRSITASSTTPPKDLAARKRYSRLACPAANRRL
jgi:hypothetical protein